jgi:CheY-like chemotaxis protein
MPVVLVVDDHPSVAAAVAATLRCAGFDAVVAHGGPQALTFVLSRPVDFVVLDAHMPGMSGPQVLAALRSGSGAYRDPPPVAVFSADDTAREESLRLGAVGFVGKGDCDALVPLIERHVPRRRPGTPAAAAPATRVA